MFILPVVLLLGSLEFVLADSSYPSSDLLMPIVDLGYELHQATFNASDSDFLAAQPSKSFSLTSSVKESGQYYNFSNVRYGAPPLGNLRFSAPTAPTGRVFNDGSKVVTCHQALPGWANTSAAWIVNGTAAFNISAGYQPPNITTLPPADPTASEDCLFLDLMVPKAIFDKAGYGEGAPV